MNEAVETIGTILTGGVIGHEVDGARARPGHGGEGVGGACANCGAIRYGPYCHACGQSGHIHRNLTALGHDLAHGVFHFEGRTWNTLPMLAWHPGELTRRYIRGERARFVSPMALFLFSVFLLFAAVSFITRPEAVGAAQGYAKARDEIGRQAQHSQDTVTQVEQRRAAKLAADPKADVAALDRAIASAKDDADTLAGIDHGLAGGAISHADLRLGSLHVSDQRIETGSLSLDRQIEHVRANPALFAYKMKMASYKYSWALIPISVPFIWLLFFWRRDVGLYDHAIFAIYSLGFMTLMTVALIALYAAGVSIGWIVLGFLLIPPLHIYRQLKGAYRLGRLGALWRTAALLIATTITSSLFALLLFWLETE